jgi:hypothetical protein
MYWLLAVLCTVLSTKTTEARDQAHYCERLLLVITGYEGNGALIHS